MWNYAKQLQYPVNIRCKEPRLAKNIISQYGGPDGRLGFVAKWDKAWGGSYLRGYKMNY